MKRIAAGSIALLALLVAGNAAAQGMYRWVDKDGKVYYSDKKPDDKPKSIEQRQVRGSVVETSDAGYALREAVKAYPVALYTAPECKEPCADARTLLNKRGVPFKEIVVSDNKTREELIKVGGAAEVPVLLVGSSLSKGFEEGAFNAALDQAGYPGKAVPGRAPAVQPKGKSETAAAKGTPAAKAQPSAPKGRYLPE